MKKTAALILALILLCLPLCGCGAAGSSDASVLSAPAGVESEDFGFYGESSSMTTAEAPMPEPAEYEEAAGASFPASSTDIPAAGESKLIYTAYLELETTEFDDSVSGIAALVDSVGGYIQNSSVNNYSSYRYANYTVRIPSDAFDGFCNSIGGICSLLNIDKSVENVSETYYDIESRLKTQRTKLDRLQELLAKADNMSDIITIESAISETEYMIEDLSGSLRHYDSLIGYSTVNISLSEVYRLRGTEEAPIGFGARLAASFRTGSSRFVSGLQSMALGLASNWAGIIIFLLAVLIVALIIWRTVVKRRRRRERRANSAEDGADGNQ